LYITSTNHKRDCCPPTLRMRENLVHKFRGHVFDAS